MKCEKLRYVLRNIDLSKGRLVRTEGELEAILVEKHKTVTKINGRKFTSYYDYLVLLKDGKKVGIILNCTDYDIHIYVLQKYREQHIVSRLINDGFLKKLWPDMGSITCANHREYEKIKHFAEISGLEFREDRMAWVC